MLARNNSEIPNFRAKAPLDSDAYASRVARVTADTVDAMPAEFRRLVNDYGYIDVYRAWKRGMHPDEIERRARASGGFFAL